MTKAEIIKEREQHLMAAGKPTLPEFPPYTEDEQRVADYLNRLMGMGGGADPIGFLLASHATLRARLRTRPPQDECL